MIAGQRKFPGRSASQLFVSWPLPCIARGARVHGASVSERQNVRVSAGCSCVEDGVALEALGNVEDVVKQEAHLGTDAEAP
eukprot:8915756-Pyramimonas_sp.AAC.1